MFKYFKDKLSSKDSSSTLEIPLTPLTKPFNFPHHTLLDIHNEHSEKHIIKHNSFEISLIDLLPHILTNDFSTYQPYHDRIYLNYNSSISKAEYNEKLFETLYSRQQRQMVPPPPSPIAPPPQPPTNITISMISTSQQPISSQQDFVSSHCYPDNSVMNLHNVPPTTSSLTNPPLPSVNSHSIPSTPSKHHINIHSGPNTVSSSNVTTQLGQKTPSKLPPKGTLTELARSQSQRSQGGQNHNNPGDSLPIANGRRLSSSTTTSNNTQAQLHAQQQHFTTHQDPQFVMKPTTQSVLTSFETKRQFCEELLHFTMLYDPHNLPKLTFSRQLAPFVRGNTIALSTHLHGLNNSAMMTHTMFFSQIAGLNGNTNLINQRAIQHQTDGLMSAPIGTIFDGDEMPLQPPYTFQSKNAILCGNNLINPPNNFDHPSLRMSLMSLSPTSNSNTLYKTVMNSNERSNPGYVNYSTLTSTQKKKFKFQQYFSNTERLGILDLIIALHWDDIKVQLKLILQVLAIFQNCPQSYERIDPAAMVSAGGVANGASGNFTTYTDFLNTIDDSNPVSASNYGQNVTSTQIYQDFLNDVTTSDHLQSYQSCDVLMTPYPRNGELSIMNSVESRFQYNGESILGSTLGQTRHPNEPSLTTKPTPIIEAVGYVSDISTLVKSNIGNPASMEKSINQTLQEPSQNHPHRQPHHARQNSSYHPRGPTRSTSRVPSTKHRPTSVTQGGYNATGVDTSRISHSIIPSTTQVSTATDHLSHPNQPIGVQVHLNNGQRALNSKNYQNDQDVAIATSPLDFDDSVSAGSSTGSIQHQQPRGGNIALNNNNDNSHHSIGARLSHHSSNYSKLHSSNQPNNNKPSRNQQQHHLNNANYSNPPPGQVYLLRHTSQAQLAMTFAQYAQGINFEQTQHGFDGGTGTDSGEIVHSSSLIRTTSGQTTLPSYDPNYFSTLPYHIQRVYELNMRNQLFNVLFMEVVLSLARVNHFTLLHAIFFENNTIETSAMAGPTSISANGSHKLDGDISTSNGKALKITTKALRDIIYSNLHLRDEDNQNLLSYAIMYGNLKLLKKLRKKCNFNQILMVFLENDLRFGSLLTTAVQNGQIDIALWLLSQDKLLMNTGANSTPTQGLALSPQVLNTSLRTSMNNVVLSPTATSQQSPQPSLSSPSTPSSTLKPLQHTSHLQYPTLLLLLKPLSCDTLDNRLNQDQLHSALVTTPVIVNPEDELDYNHPADLKNTALSTYKLFSRLPQSHIGTLLTNSGLVNNYLLTQFPFASNHFASLIAASPQSTFNVFCNHMKLLLQRHSQYHLSKTHDGQLLLDRTNSPIASSNLQNNILQRTTSQDCANSRDVGAGGGSTTGSSHPRSGYHNNLYSAISKLALTTQLVGALPLSHHLTIPQDVPAVKIINTNVHFVQTFENKDSQIHTLFTGATTSQQHVDIRPNTELSNNNNSQNNNNNNNNSRISNNNKLPTMAATTTIPAKFERVQRHFLFGTDFNIIELIHDHLLLPVTYSRFSNFFVFSLQTKEQRNLIHNQLKSDLKAHTTKIMALFHTIFAIIFQQQALLRKSTNNHGNQDLDELFLPLLISNTTNRSIVTTLLEFDILDNLFLRQIQPRILTLQQHLGSSNTTGSNETTPPPPQHSSITAIPSLTTPTTNTISGAAMINTSNQATNSTIALPMMSTVSNVDTKKAKAAQLDYLLYLERTVKLAIELRTKVIIQMIPFVPYNSSQHPNTTQGTFLLTSSSSLSSSHSTTVQHTITKLLLSTMDHCGLCPFDIISNDYQTPVVFSHILGLYQHYNLLNLTNQFGETLAQKASNMGNYTKAAFIRDKTPATPTATIIPAYLRAKNGMKNNAALQQTHSGRASMQQVGALRASIRDNITSGNLGPGMVGVNNQSIDHNTSQTNGQISLLMLIKRIHQHVGSQRCLGLCTQHYSSIFSGPNNTTEIGNSPLNNNCLRSSINGIIPSQRMSFTGGVPSPYTSPTTNNQGDFTGNNPLYSKPSSTNNNNEDYPQVPLSFTPHPSAVFSGQVQLDININDHHGQMLNLNPQNSNQTNIMEPSSDNPMGSFFGTFGDHITSNNYTPPMFPINLESYCLCCIYSDLNLVSSFQSYIEPFLSSIGVDRDLLRGGDETPTPHQSTEKVTPSSQPTPLSQYQPGITDHIPSASPYHSRRDHVVTTADPGDHYHRFDDDFDDNARNRLNTIISMNGYNIDEEEGGFGNTRGSPLLFKKHLLAKPPSPNVTDSITNPVLNQIVIGNRVIPLPLLSVIAQYPTSTHPVLFQHLDAMLQSYQSLTNRFLHLLNHYISVHIFPTIRLHLCYSLPLPYRQLTLNNDDIIQMLYFAEPTTLLGQYLRKCNLSFNWRLATAPQHSTKPFRNFTNQVQSMMVTPGLPVNILNVQHQPYVAHEKDHCANVASTVGSVKSGHISNPQSSSHGTGSYNQYSNDHQNSPQQHHHQQQSPLIEQRSTKRYTIFQRVVHEFGPLALCDPSHPVFSNLFTFLTQAIPFDQQVLTGCSCQHCKQRIEILVNNQVRMVVDESENGMRKITSQNKPDHMRKTAIGQLDDIDQAIGSNNPNKPPTLAPAAFFVVENSISLYGELPISQYDLDELQQSINASSLTQNVTSVHNLPQGYGSNIRTTPTNDKIINHNSPQSPLLASGSSRVTFPSTLSSLAATRSFDPTSPNTAINPYEMSPAPKTISIIPPNELPPQLSNFTNSCLKQYCHRFFPYNIMPLDDAEHHNIMVLQYLPYIAQIITQTYVYHCLKFHLDVIAQAFNTALESHEGGEKLHPNTNVSNIMESLNPTLDGNFPSSSSSLTANGTFLGQQFGQGAATQSHSATANVYRPGSSSSSTTPTTTYTTFSAPMNSSQSHNYPQHHSSRHNRLGTENVLIKDDPMYNASLPSIQQHNLQRFYQAYSGLFSSSSLLQASFLMNSNTDINLMSSVASTRDGGESSQFHTRSFVNSSPHSPLKTPSVTSINSPGSPNRGLPRGAFPSHFSPTAMRAGLQLDSNHTILGNNAEVPEPLTAMRIPQYSPTKSISEQVLTLLAHFDRFGLPLPLIEWNNIDVEIFSKIATDCFKTEFANANYDLILLDCLLLLGAKVDVPINETNNLFNRSIFDQAFQGNVMGGSNTSMTNDSNSLLPPTPLTVSQPHPTDLNLIDPLIIPDNPSGASNSAHMMLPYEHTSGVSPWSPNDHNNNPTSTSPSSPQISEALSAQGYQQRSQQPTTLHRPFPTSPSYQPSVLGGGSLISSPSQLTFTSHNQPHSPTLPPTPGSAAFINKINMATYATLSNYRYNANQGSFVVAPQYQNGLDGITPEKELDINSHLISRDVDANNKSNVRDSINYRMSAVQPGGLPSTSTSSPIAADHTAKPNNMTKQYVPQAEQKRLMKLMQVSENDKNNKNTALFEVTRVRFNHLLIALFISHGADPLYTNAHNQFIEQFVCDEKYLDLMEFLAWCTTQHYQIIDQTINTPHTIATNPLIVHSTPPQLFVRHEHRQQNQLQRAQRMSILAQQRHGNDSNRPNLISMVSSGLMGPNFPSRRTSVGLGSPSVRPNSPIAPQMTPSTLGSAHQSTNNHKISLAQVHPPIKSPTGIPLRAIGIDDNHNNFLNYEVVANKPRATSVFTPTPHHLSTHSSSQEPPASPRSANPNSLTNHTPKTTVHSIPSPPSMSIDDVVKFKRRSDNHLAFTPAQLKLHHSLLEEDDRKRELQRLRDSSQQNKLRESLSKLQLDTSTKGQSTMTLGATLSVPEHPPQMVNEDQRHHSDDSVKVSVTGGGSDENGRNQETSQNVHQPFSSTLSQTASLLPSIHVSSQHTNGEDDGANLINDELNEPFGSIPGGDDTSEDRITGEHDVALELTRSPSSCHSMGSFGHQNGIDISQPQSTKEIIVNRGPPDSRSRRSILVHYDPTHSSQQFVPQPEQARSNGPVVSPNVMDLLAQQQAQYRKSLYNSPTNAHPPSFESNTGTSKCNNTQDNIENTFGNYNAFYTNPPVDTCPLEVAITETVDKKGEYSPSVSYQNVAFNFNNSDSDTDEDSCINSTPPSNDAVLINNMDTSRDVIFNDISNTNNDTQFFTDDTFIIPSRYDLHQLSSSSSSSSPPSNSTQSQFRGSVSLFPQDRTFTQPTLIPMRPSISHLSPPQRGQFVQSNHRASISARPSVMRPSFVHNYNNFTPSNDKSAPPGAAPCRPPPKPPQ